MSDWVVKFEGPAIEDGSMAVEDVVTVMQAASKLAKRAAATVYGRDHDLEVRVFAPRQGSFELVVQLAATVATTVIANLLTDYVKHKLARRRSGMEKRPDDRVERLSRSKLAERALAELTSPLRHNGVLRMRLTTRDGDAIEITREERHQLDSASDRVWEEEREATVQVVSPSFVQGNWRLSEGGHEFSAPITDRDFNERIQAGTETFAKGDTLECRVALYVVTNARGERAKVEYEVIEVFGHVPR
ncbi:MAG: hypothetical protein OXU77_08345 [Gammaproteobacteria bacterium]|nr:hypothetical protein [Gammaproteobacteria bacterium]MDE0444127.1 hypothetical protein [Gammaproteobacteria bacterium]